MLEKSHEGGVMKRFGWTGRKAFTLLGVLLSLSVWMVSTSDGSSKPADAAAIQRGMQEVIDFLDSPGYAAFVSWDEHIVLVYRLTQGREPTPLEFFLLRAFRDDIGMRRSTVLSVALRGKARRTTWVQCRDFLSRVKISDFRTDSGVMEIARRLAAVPPTEIVEALKQMAYSAEMDRPRKELQVEPPVPGVRYKTYFGFLHAHSELSDGEGDPVGAYIYAYVQGGLDFFALTDHSEFFDAWPWDDGWEELVSAAHVTYLPGTYVTLWGFEWSNPVFGHINVLKTPDYVSAISKVSIPEFYDWLVDRPGGFGRYNHPGDYDYLDCEFLHLEVYPDTVPQMVGIETWNGNDSFDKYYYDGGWETDFSYWDEGNLQGWHLGALGAQDNHHADWGTRNQFRTAVLAEGLTREQMVDAYRNRRFYATEDKDLYLDFRCQGYPMGSHIYGVERRFKVKARDKSGDTFQEVRLYRNGELLKAKAVSGSRIRVRFKDLSRSGSDYYYAIVRQNDDNDLNGRNDEAISSPIWID
jgi:hypothetical protein